MELKEEQPSGEPLLMELKEEQPSGEQEALPSQADTNPETDSNPNPKPMQGHSDFLIWVLRKDRHLTST